MYVVTLRRHRDEVSRPQFDLGVTRPKQDVPLQAHQRGVSGALMFAKSLPGVQRDQRLPQPSPRPAVQRRRTAPAVTPPGQLKVDSRQLLDPQDIHPPMVAPGRRRLHPRRTTVV